ncbi:hypothetical protein CsSME_00014769 [Camellia sinensis var. sinensis]
MLLQPMLAWVLGSAVLAAAAASAADETSSGCSRTCDQIKVPYPFGTKEGCYMEEHFHVTCDHSTDPHKLYLNTSDASIEIRDILLSGELHISSQIARDCYNKQGVQVFNNQISVRSGKFPISITRNKFIAIGCDTYGVLEGFDGQNYSTGCWSQCDNINKVINGSCSGIGCCEKSIPKGVTSFKFNVSSHDKHTRVWEFNPCSYAFVAEETNYAFSSVDLANLQNRSMVPVVLDWAVGNQRCSEAKKNLTSFACKANSHCYDFDNGPGYRCNCSQGYEGNPYSPNGCSAQAPATSHAKIYLAHTIVLVQRAMKNRLRIATETAAALSYLHSAASTPIIHRDVKSTNILLDDNYVAKVSDFGSSRLIPMDQTQLTTLVQGTLGYLDPEYFQTSQLTERSDVYSFGVVLVELLTSKKAISFDRPEAERNLAMYFISAMKEDCLFEIVDEQVINDAKADQLKEANHEGSGNGARGIENDGEKLMVK